MAKQKLSEFQMREIESFWDWIKENKEDVDVQYYDKNMFYLYLPFDHDIFIRHWRNWSEKSKVILWQGKKCATWIV